MIHAILDWMRFNFLFGLICLTAGLIVTLPFLLIKPIREHLLRSDYNIETIGFIALFIAIVLIGLYNHLGAGSA